MLLLLVLRTPHLTTVTGGRLENISQDKESNGLNGCDNSSKNSNNQTAGSFQNQIQNGKQFNQNHSSDDTNPMNLSDTTNKNTVDISLNDESLQLIGSAATSLGVNVARGVGLLGQAAADAWDFFSSTLDQLGPGDSDSGSDVSWHDTGSDVSDEDDVDFVDANEDQRVSTFQIDFLY